MKTIDEQARWYAKRWCEKHKRNSRHVRIRFAVDFANNMIAPREKLIAELVAEMRRHLPILERMADSPGLFDCIARGTGVATLNGYRAAVAKAEAQQ